jgi:hypothetical protein
MGAPADTGLLAGVPDPFLEGVGSVASATAATATPATIAPISAASKPWYRNPRRMSFSLLPALDVEQHEQDP